MLGIGANRTVIIGVGSERVDVLTRSLPRHAWHHRSAQVGAKRDRWYSWPLITITDSDYNAAAGQHHLAGPVATARPPSWLITAAPAHTGDPCRLGGVAGWRWIVEESCQTSKELVGLDEHQMRRWKSSRRRATLAILAKRARAVRAIASRSRI